MHLVSHLVRQLVRERIDLPRSEVSIGYRNLDSEQILEAQATDADARLKAGRMTLSHQCGAGRPKQRGRARLAPAFQCLLFAPGTSLNRTFLSGRMSGGMPSTRSAMMLRRISSLPPSMRLAGERMNCLWNWLPKPESSSSSRMPPV